MKNSTKQEAPKLSTKYPTKEEILESDPLHQQPDIDVLAQWKEEHFDGQWRTKTAAEKLISLAWLAKTLSPGINVKEGNMWATFFKGPETPFIMADPIRPSIISMLHEIAHTIFGPSELAACVYSTKLFAEVFPDEYAKLTWEGHNLRLKR